MKLELASGKRPSAGYIHNDLNAFDGIDVVGKAWDIDLPDQWLDEVIGIAFVEHLSYDEAAATFANIRRMLKPGGSWLFDVPNLAAWCRYYDDPDAPFDRDYVLRTIYGWNRWDGDGHKSGWDETLLTRYLSDAGFDDVEISELPTQWLERDIYRFRFTRPEEDCHFYVKAR